MFRPFALPDGNDSLFNGFVTQMEMWKAKDDTAIVQDHQVIRAYPSGYLAKGIEGKFVITLSLLPFGQTISAAFFASGERPQKDPHP
jgi:hypothetical protein